RGVEVVEKLAQQAKVDFIFGTLFSNVVIAAAPRAGELKIPYLVVSEGYHVPSGKMNRYVFQPGITDVHAQVTALVPWIVKNLGARKPKLFGFIDTREGVDMASPGLDFLEGSHIWEALPRYADGYPTRYETFYRARVGVNASGASQQDPKNVSTYSHMFGVW